MAGDLRHVQAAITQLIRSKYRSDPRTWSEIEVIRYQNLCELEQALLVLEGR